ncbi:ATP-binding protein [Microbacterium sp. KRD172]|uniref:ATP-binding protein n=1 Tax=Microbacterium sp. KRD172 TaxID=2729727 RepID=UPI0019D0D3D5|nr:ATP-binding protein [Microbacterium sp. KRD172]
MSDALFSALDVDTGDDAFPGYRLHRVEVFNWGTFDRQVWDLELDGRTALLTGDIGSGKSTIVDAISTLLLPAQRIAYNKAAGAEAKERNLRSYVEGHYKSERNEQTGASRPVGLRDHTSYSVILGSFRNEAYDETVTLAQVFHQKDRAGQPDRFYVTASHALAVDPDFSDFGSELTALRKRLRQQGADIDTSFPDYSRRMRRLLGIRSEQAMDLFHQTVSMKSVGNLTDFVRSHMLEEEDSAERVRAIIEHFENLTRAHESVQRATAQLAVLDPLVEAGDRYDAAIDRRDDLTASRAAVDPYVAEAMLVALADESTRVEGARTKAGEQQERMRAARQALVPERDRLIAERAGAGGDRLVEIDRALPRLDEELDRRSEARARYLSRLEDAGLDPVTDAGGFAVRRVDAERARSEADAAREGVGARQEPLGRRRFELDAALTRTNDELAILQGRRSNLDSKLLAVRDRLCAGLGLDEQQVPFAGELIDVADVHEGWRGAAERVLGGFATMMLVAQSDYDAVSRWVNDTHLGAKLRYLRVPDRQVRSVPARADEALRLRDILEVEEGPFAAFVTGELQRRGEHQLVQSAAELRGADRAVTRAGLVRDRDRHEKDDRFAIDDPRNWVLGRTSERKLAALRDEAAEYESERGEVLASLAALQREENELQSRLRALDALADVTRWSDLDTESSQAEITALHDERSRLIAGSNKLEEIEKALTRVDEQAVRLDEDLEAGARAIGDLDGEAARLTERTQREQRALEPLTASEIAAARERYGALDTLLADKRSRRTLEGLETLRKRLADEIARLSDAVQREINGHITSVQAKMHEMLRNWPELRAEHDAEVGALGSFRELHSRVRADDLPRFESEFRHQLNTNAVTELAGFHNWLRRQADEIHARVDRINEALGAIDYRPGRVIRIIADPTVNQEIRDFRADLRAATSDLVDPESGDAERRFEQVRAIIERFRGREAHSDRDRIWTRFVTDVRNWYLFAASEQDRDTGEEFEHYTDSDGKSGGQKEKLAYTILAASLAYQFGLEWGVQKARDFRFAVIDEAFGRGSDESTRYALKLFGRLGLQLLIVTPLQKVHVIEPFISAIGFVDNPTGARSRVHTLTIEEYHKRRKDAS